MPRRKSVGARESVSPTSKDVAKRAGVSVATVSRVLNDSSNVSPDSRRKVLQAIKALDYQPSRAAQLLRARRGRVLGLIISDIQNPFFTSVVRGIEDVAYEHGYSLVLCNTDENPEKEQLYINVMRAEAAAGVILAAVSEDSPRVRGLLDHHIPVVAIDRQLKDEMVDSVCVDNVEAAREAVSTLLDLGHRRIGLIGVPRTITTGRDRYAGYLRAFHERQLRVSRDWICFGDTRETGGYLCAGHLLQLKPPVTALFATNSLMTLGALRRIHEMKLRIPEDISIIGFDDMPWAELLRPALSNVAQPTYELGRTAAQLLLKRLEHPQEPPQHVVLKTRLIMRDSVAPLEESGRAFVEHAPNGRVSRTMRESRNG
ncbi:MAG: LacI family DNA-binding transcriptional regulator [Anaerolineae bacterium]|nr:LacI family transcriptional regulator [Thermoflexales bacterium]MDW8407131.1 LacI family DNA-binding transcriptional regulator [Anaerolineae bacterium]